MQQGIVEELGQIPMAPNLAATLVRAAEAARAQRAAAVTLEHLLLALTEDPDAALIIQVSQVDPARLRADLVNHLTGAMPGAGAPSDVSISPDLRRVLEAAAAAARQSRRREINGAIVLAAIVGDGNSAAAELLRAHGLTFEAAIKALQRAAQQPQREPARSPPAPQPPPGEVTPPQPAPAAPPAPRAAAPAETRQRTDELLATVRERIGAAPPHPQQQPRQQSATVQRGEPEEPPARPPPQIYAPPQPAPPQPKAPYEPDWQAAELPPPQQPSHVPPPTRAPDAPMRPAAGAGAGANPSPPRPPAAPPEPTAHDGVPRTQPPRQPPPPPPMPMPQPAPAARTAPPSAPWPEPDARRAAPPPHPPLGPVQRMPAPNDGPGFGGGPPPAARPPQHQPQPMPQPMPPRGGPPAPQPMPHASAPGRHVAPPAIETGQLVENIPRRMRSGAPTLVEIRIGRDKVQGLAKGMAGPGPATHHPVLVTRAMSVRLRAPDGGFFIETASPETQWIDNTLGVQADDFASWRWTVTPTARGTRRLQMIVSSRTIGPDGLAAETAFPDQMVEVKVRVNYALAAKKTVGWTAAAVIGGALAEFGEGALNVVLALLK